MNADEQIKADGGETVTVFYDGACPSCIRDRQVFENLAGDHGRDVCWFDITGQEEALRRQGIDPHKALTELHVRESGRPTVSELNAYILLLSKVPWLKPLAWLIGLPLVRPWLSAAYRRRVERRLTRSGRL